MAGRTLNIRVKKFFVYFLCFKAQKFLKRVGDFLPLVKITRHIATLQSTIFDRYFFIEVAERIMG